MKIECLSARIALRYLRAPKSHSAVNTISIVSVTGVAIATAAIICVLSVFNGFRSVLGDRLDRLSPDVIVEPAEGKVIDDADSLARMLMTLSQVEIAMPAVSDNALVIANSREMPVKLKGVDRSLYPSVAAIDSMRVYGNTMDMFEIDGATISVGVAQRLGIYNENAPLLIFAPRREGRINLANPMESFLTDSLNVEAVFQSMQSEVDENTVICDISKVRELFQYSTEGSAIELKGAAGVSSENLASLVKSRLGDSYVVKNRVEQQQMNFRMVSIEKWVTFLLLIFILMIASFNIISTLCMIVLEKQGALGVFSSMGMRRRDIGRVFGWESMFIALTGGLAGLIVGISLCLLQQHFGIIKLSANPEVTIMQAYPVVVEWNDIWISLAPVVVIGLICAQISSSFAKSRIRENSI